MCVRPKPFIILKIIKMKYTISKEKKVIEIKKNRNFMFLYYGGGILISVTAILLKFNSLPVVNLLFFFGIILLSPFAFFYFDRNFKRKLNFEYEFLGNKLVITESEKNVIKELESIISLSKIHQGHKIVSNKGTFYILDWVENKEDLIKEIEQKIL